MSKNTSSLSDIMENLTESEVGISGQKSTDEKTSFNENKHQTKPQFKPAPVKPVQTVSEEIANIMKELNDKDLNLPVEKILEYRKKLNPYGRTIEGANKFINISVTQIKYEYLKKLITTALIGFVNVMADEWKVPDGIPVVPVYEYLEDKTKLDTPEAILKGADTSAIADFEFNRKWMEKRIIVKEFFEEIFQFNPDEHVRSAYRDNKADGTRRPINTPAAKLAKQMLMKTDREYKAREQLYDDVKRLTEENSDEQVDSKSKKQKTIKGRNGKTMVVDINKSKPVKKLDSTLKDPRLTETVTEMIPPHDTFGRFNEYLKSNYEELRGTVHDLYNDTPDLELAINPYSCHDTLEEAQESVKKHAPEFISEVFTVHTGKWNFIDSFKEQRDSVKFYNDKTVVLEGIMEQMKRDEELGRDLMNKRVAKKKKQNVLESGEDSESFNKWKKQNSDIQKLTGPTGDQADPDCPDDAVQVDVWKIAGGSVSKTNFFTQATAPTLAR